ncbi:MAG: NADH-quinone oxidoreductase subunit C [Arcobacter sp.]|nr:MAG: NADH-quinone oxidoreductase subunit C [Arcobacter sp.]
MRKYVPKDDVQKKPYYTDRFWVAPQVPKFDVSTDEVFAADLEAIKAVAEVKEAYIQVDQMVVIINPNDNFKVAQALKETCDYNQLSELGAIDWLAKQGQYEIFYQFLSMSKRKRLRIKCFIDEKQAVESLNPLYRSADWAEREMYDMSGVKINNHPYMKRILMPDDWVGHPLLKTYPLQGDEAASWYEVDRIYGKEARDIIGPENRDPAMVNRYDTERFTRLGHEVSKGTEYNKDQAETPLVYQEEGGVFAISKFIEDDAVVITDRKR